MDKQIWATALERLEKDIPQASYLWLRKSRLVPTNAPDKYILQVSNPAIRKQLQTRCLIHIERALTEALGGKRNIRVAISSAPAKHGAAVAVADPAEMLFPDEAATDAAGGASPALADVLPTRQGRLTPDQRRRKMQMRQNQSLGSNGQAAGAPAASYNQPSSSMRPRIAQASPTVPTPELQEPPAWLNSRYTFDTFIVGGGNHFAYAACMAVADAPGNAYNPLFLYGGVGLGKTHLMHAIAHAVAPQGCRTLYVTSETFTNEIINAIRYRTTEEFRAKYRSVDVLLVDDVQFIAGKDSTEEEFFHTFNALHESRKQIVICSDRPPKAIDLAERLRSRFEWGLIVDIQPPDLETRLAILRAKAEVLCPDIDNAVLNYLAERVQTNVRELEGLLNRVVAYATLLRAPLSVDIAKQSLHSLSPVEKPRRRVAVSEILAAISNYYHISLDDLRGKQRDKHIVTPRQVAMWLMRQDTEASLMEIGMELGGRDHSTILHGCDKIEKEFRREGSPLQQEIAGIRQQFAG